MRTKLNKLAQQGWKYSSVLAQQAWKYLKILVQRIRQHRFTRPKIRFSLPEKPIRAFLINHPDQSLDQEVSLRIKEGTHVPREAVITENGELRPILIYSKKLTHLPQAEGMITKRSLFGLRTKWIALDTDWRFLTVKEIYRDAPQNEDQPHYDSPREFLNAIGEGRLGESIDSLGPYRYGNDLMLAGLRRQITKAKRLEAAIRLEKSIKWMLATVIASTVFLIIIASG